MITSKKDYRYFKETDRIALRINTWWPAIILNERWKFERMLRKTEYFYNCKKSVFWKPYILFLKWRLRDLSIRYGFSIPLNVFGPGLSIENRGGVIINTAARVGANCRIHNCVVIGSETKEAPKIGNDVYIGPGAKIFGNVEIADGIAIGANAVVTQSFLEPGITIGGVPARKISNKGSSDLINHATRLYERKNQVKRRPA